MMFATVTTAAPLRVRLDLAASDSEALLIQRDDSYAPAVDDRVCVDTIGTGHRLVVVVVGAI